ncbi:DUF3592 domain-containing protein [Metapseudomonas otitidis]|uniref:DUF3592 domain-containing protein n=1 Tax=Metapseudomonas otitidis TaxID=319939 RepID=UPI002738AC4B|nr:DUF3592 domain-containing protein [Pseudomonas sp. A29(2023)]MDL5599127.1 DUF3592 domain-containing protein [Bacillus subtilis]
MKLGWLWVFPALGGLMIAGAVAVQVARLSDQARMTLASAEVIDISGGCPTVAFRTAAGEAVEHTSSGCSSPPAFELGESARVYYDPANPRDAHLDSFVDNWVGSLVLGGIGAVFALIGSCFVVPPLLARRRAAQLAVSGQAVMAEVVDVRLNGSLSVNGQNPWRIVAQWKNPATGKLHVFNSENLWFDPSRFLPDDGWVRVLIDPANPRRYAMDTAFLPELAD